MMHGELMWLMASGKSKRQTSTAYRMLSIRHAASLEAPLVASLFCKQLTQFLNLMPVPVVWYWSFSQTMSDEFVPVVVASIVVPFCPPMHNAAQSEPGVTSSASMAVRSENTANRCHREKAAMV
ncbi:exo-alpha-sialidase neuraminidase [Colletotrichum asianum]